jgi:hypothetical protein
MRGEERLVGDLRARHPRPMSSRERGVVAALATAYAGAAVAMATFLHWNRDADPLLISGMVILFALVSCVEFEVGTSTAVATPLVAVPMFFLLPLPIVPLLIPLGYLLATLPDFIQRKKHLDRWVYSVVDSWFAIGPVLVISLLADGPPDISHWPVYTFAFVAQAATDAGPAVLREWLVRGLTSRENLIFTLWIERIDAVLWPIGLMTAIAAYDHPLAVVFVLPLLWLLRTFSRERKERYSAALELNRAYRGTVMLLSDVVEADDNYTADHCRGVVELVNAVADELEIAEDERQELEFAALLQQAGRAQRRGVRADEDPHDRGPGAARPSGRTSRPRWHDRPLLPRALGRQRLPGRPRRLRDPAGCAHRFRLRCLQRDDHGPPVPRRDEPRDGHRGAVGECRLPVRSAHRGRARRRGEARQRAG